MSPTQLHVMLTPQGMSIFTLKYQCKEIIHAIRIILMMIVVARSKICVRVIEPLIKITYSSARSILIQ